MRHNQRLTFEDLRDETRAAVEQFAASQAALARELGVTRGAVSRAMKEAGPALASLQRRIVEHLTGYRIEEKVEVTFRALRSEGDQG